MREGELAKTLLHRLACPAEVGRELMARGLSSRGFIYMDAFMAVSIANGGHQCRRDGRRHYM
jgi:hypothetical protein